MSSNLMSVLYLLTSPPPIIEGTDAAFQEVSALRAHSMAKPSISVRGAHLDGPFRRSFLAFTDSREIRRLERSCEINHVFHSVPYPFPVLRLSAKPGRLHGPHQPAATRKAKPA